MGQHTDFLVSPIHSVGQTSGYIQKPPEIITRCIILLSFVILDRHHLHYYELDIVMKMENNAL